MGGVTERLLLRFSKPIDEAFAADDSSLIYMSSALSRLKDAFGERLYALIKDMTILDFGCGYGYQSVAMAVYGAKKVVGVDIIQNNIEFAKNLANNNKVSEKTEFLLDPAHLKNMRFDLIISQNCFEHYSDPQETLAQFKKVLGKTGRILITFGPLWFSPYGSHMHFFTKIPYINILFCEKTVMAVRRHYRQDGANRYEEVAGGLNKMTVGKFEQLIKDSGLAIKYIKTCGVKNLDFLTMFPLLRELVTTRIDAVLSKK